MSVGERIRKSWKIYEQEVGAYFLYWHVFTCRLYLFINNIEEWTLMKKKEVNLNIRISKELRDEFRRVADESVQNPSELIRRWIKKYIEKNKKSL